MGIQATAEPPVPPAISIPAAAYEAGRTLSVGLPVGKNQLDGRHIRIKLSDGRWLVDAQTRVMGRWPDGDPKWVMASFPAPAAGAGPVVMTMERTPGPAALGPSMATKRETDIEVRAGGHVFGLPTTPGFGVVDHVVAPDGNWVIPPGGAGLDLVAVGDTGQVYRGFRDQVWIEDNGPYKAQIVMLGRLASANDGGRTSLCSFLLEAEFDAARPGPIFRVTLKNDDQTARRNIRFQSVSIVGTLAVDGHDIAVQAPTPEPPYAVATTGETTVVQHNSGYPLRGLDDRHFKIPDGLRAGYEISSPSLSRSYPVGSYPQTIWLTAADDRNEVFASIRHAASNWGSITYRQSGELEIGLLSRLHGMHTMRLGTWETREAMVLFGRRGSIDGRAEAFALEYPRLVRPTNIAVWNRTSVFPYPLSNCEGRSAAIAAADGRARDLHNCPESPYRVKYHYAGQTGGSNQWDPAHDYWFAWASTGDPNAWLIAEAWADYRTDHAVPHAGTADAVNEGEFNVTSDDEVFDTGHRHSKFIPIWFWHTGQMRFSIAAHDEFSSLYGNDRIRARYMESRITSRLIELGAIYSAFARDREWPDAHLLYERVRDYLGVMLSLRYDINDPDGSKGWANEPRRRDRDPRTFWAAKPGKGDPRKDVTFMVASLLPQALATWAQYAPPGDPHVPVVRQRLVDLADFTWEYLICKSENDPTCRGTLFNFDTRPGTPPAPSHGTPEYTDDGTPDLYHPLYAAFVGAYYETHDPKYLERAAYWCEAQTYRGAPWATFHRPDFQSFCAAFLQH